MYIKLKQNQNQKFPFHKIFFLIEFGLQLFSIKKRILHENYDARLQKN